MRSFLSTVGLAALLSFASLEAGAAPPPPLIIGEVTSTIVRDDADLGAELRAVVEQELPGLDVGKPRPKPTVLSVSLVQLERTSAPGGSKAQVSVVVSATLRDKKKGAVVAVVEGRARAENEGRLLDFLEHAVLKSAVRGALARVPEALDSQR
jgi:hypothetical protein